MNRHLTDSFLGTSIPCECGRTHEVPAIDISLGGGALDGLPDVVGRLGLGKNTLLVADTRTYDAAGKRAQQVLSAAGIDVELLVIEGEHPHVDEETAAPILPRAEGKDFLTAVGAGTINDLTKHAGTALGIRYVCVGTAPSMNGYTSIIIAITRHGVKTTTTGTPPVAVVADTDILAACPREMILAGLGDLLSKNVSGADWWLTKHIDGEYFCELPLNMVSDVIPWAERAAPAIASAEPRAVEELTEYLLVSGLSMTVAGISRPSSGGEHLISHLWDMQNMQSGKELALHGTQVGVGTVLAAKLYDEILAFDSLDTRTILAGYPDPDALRRRTDDFHGPVAAAVWEEFRHKLPSRERLQHIADSWDTIRKTIPGYRAEAGALESILNTAGAPTHPGQLGKTPVQTCDTIVHAREIRARYTGLDLAADIGILEDFASRHARPPD